MGLEDEVLRRYAKTSPKIKKTADKPMKALILGGRKARRWVKGCRPAAEKWLSGVRRR